MIGRGSERADRDDRRAARGPPREGDGAERLAVAVAAGLRPDQELAALAIGEGEIVGSERAGRERGGVGGEVGGGVGVAGVDRGLDAAAAAVPEVLWRERVLAVEAREHLAEPRRRVELAALVLTGLLGGDLEARAEVDGAARAAADEAQERRGRDDEVARGHHSHLGRSRSI
ncbi:MAG: hypothetical protein KC486_33230, partial [Myxococcales bacterium]|nr:hypothetical protein [Myxococcales bacterium]